jgi:hypothetical protein
MPSVPGDFNDAVLCGVVLQTHVVHGRISGILLKVKVSDDDPLIIVVVPPKPMNAGAIERNDRIWVRGSLACDRNISRKSMHFIQAQHLEVVRRRRQPASATMAAEGRGM